MKLFPLPPYRYCQGKAESGSVSLGFIALLIVAGLFGLGPAKTLNSWLPEMFWSSETRLLMLPPHLRPKPYEFVPFKIPPGAQTGKN